MPEKTVNPARAAAFNSLLKMDSGKYTNIEVSVTLDRSVMDERDKALYTRLVYGCVERLITLDYIIAKYSSRPLSEISPEALCALRLGVYQLAFTDKIPDHAAVDETVSLVKKSQRGFVNAVLRAFLRDGKKTDYPEKFPDNISVEYSVPAPLVLKLSEVFGEEELRAFFEKTLEDGKLSLTVNRLKISVEDFIKKYGGEKTFAEGSVLCDNLDAVSAGFAFVQDTASAFCAEVLDAKAGEVAVDTCAAPGGKSFATAIKMENRGEIFSFDLHKNKLSLIDREAKKLGIDIIKTAERDAGNPDPDLIGRADRVICDAPCSGLGVIGKKPDIKYKDLGDISRLPEIQRRVLEGASKYVKCGGTLVYSTCTVLPEENEENVRAFLASHPDFEPYPFDYKGESVTMLTLTPQKDNTDGFFIARLRRKND